jgi:hypothetical protein
MKQTRCWSNSLLLLLLLELGLRRGLVVTEHWAGRCW